MTAQRRNYAEVRRAAAHRHAGRRYWRWYVFGEPLLRRLGVPLLAVLALAAAWWFIPHLLRGVVSGVVAAVLTVGWLMYQSSGRALQRRMNGRATGDVPRGVGLGFAVAGVVLALAAASVLALASPYA